MIMKRFFGKKFKNEIIIENDEFIHLSKVLRLKENDKIICNINDEFNYFCTIKEIGKKNCVTTINSKELCPALPNKKITLFQALPKKEYIDEIIPKSVELGLTNLQFFISDFSNTKTINETRINQQILSACKQCERSMLMQNFPLITFKEMTEKLKNFDLVIFANEKETKKSIFDLKNLKSSNNIALIIGNEGGFSDMEMNSITKITNNSITLGKRILRCSTAVVALLSLVNAITNN